MSMVTWVGNGTSKYVEYNSSAFRSMEECASEIAWKLPAKIVGNKRFSILRLLTILSEKHGMEPDEFWSVGFGKIGSQSSIEHPGWDEVLRLLGVNTLPKTILRMFRLLPKEKEN